MQLQRKAWSRPPQEHKWTSQVRSHALPGTTDTGMSRDELYSPICPTADLQYMPGETSWIPGYPQAHQTMTALKSG